MSRSSFTVTVTALLVVLGVTTALAVDWQAYPQFRHVSGMPGNGFSVQPDGDVEFGGALHMNVPCAYTPSEGNYSVLYASASKDSEIHLRFKGEDVDGSAHLGFGLGDPHEALYACCFIVDSDFVNTINLQWQVQGETQQDPALAIGIVDIFDQRMHRVNTRGGARSLYITATRRVTHQWEPAVYVSIGAGNGKFHGLFGGVSYYPSEQLNLGLEYDGRVARPHISYNLHEGDEWQAQVFGAWSDFDRPVVGFHFSHTE